MSAKLIGCMNPLCPSFKGRQGETYLKLNLARTGTYLKKPYAEGKKRWVPYVRGGWKEQKSWPINPTQPLLWETVCSVDQCNGLCNKTIISHSLSFQSGIVSSSVYTPSKWMITGEVSHPLQTLQQALLPIKHGPVRNPPLALVRWALPLHPSVGETLSPPLWLAIDQGHCFCDHYTTEGDRLHLQGNDQRPVWELSTPAFLRRIIDMHSHRQAHLQWTKASLQHKGNLSHSLSKLQNVHEALPVAAPPAMIFNITKNWSSWKNLK